MKTFKIVSNHQAARWAAPWTSRDYWLAHTLGEAMTDAGGRMVLGDADVTVYVWGSIITPIDVTQNNVLWVVGHPAALLSVLESQADGMKDAFSKVYCASKRFCDTLFTKGLPAEWLVCPAPRRAPVAPPVTHDLAFVGNADPRKGRPDLVNVLQKHDSVCYGGGWGALGDKWAGDYIHFSKLGEVWSAAKVVPYSTYADMRAHAFAADAALDAMVNGEGLVLADANDAYADLGIETPQWSTPDELAALVERALTDEPWRRDAKVKQRLGARSYTYKHVAEVLCGS